MKHILGPMRRAIESYEMIKPNERIAIGVSGGKDSMALLTAMARYRQFSPTPFDICAITVDLGFEKFDYKPIESYCQEIGVEYVRKATEIGKVVFDVRKEKSPCSLCAKMKRGALHDAALAAGCGTVALGHHQDDAVETFFMSLFYEGRINCFLPVTYLDRKGITLIRPLVYVKERDIKFCPDLRDVPVVASGCPADGFSKRAETKEFIKRLRKTHPDLNDRVMRAMENGGQFNLWFDSDGSLKKRKF